MPRVKSIHLYSHDYGVDAGKLAGKVEFEGKHGTISLAIDGERTKRMIEVMADLIVDTARDTAQLLRDDLLERAKDRDEIGDVSGSDVA